MGELFDLYFPRLYNYFRIQTADPDLADELASMTLEQAWAFFRRYRTEREPFGNWLFAIAHNLMNEQRRFEKAHPGWATQSQTEDRGQEQLEPTPRLQEALGQLGEIQRDLVGLKFAAQLSNRQIASLTGLDEIQIRKILLVALQTLGSDSSDGQPEVLPVLPQDLQQELDTLTKVTTSPQTNLTPENVRQLYAAAQTLAMADFNAGSKMRGALRARLMVRLPRLRRWQSLKLHNIDPRLTTILFVAVVLLVLALIWSLGNGLVR